jgi:hypothetical protein
VVARITGWYARRQHGADLTPAADAWSHTPGLLAGYGARFNHALGIESQGLSEGSFCAIPERERVAT